MSKSGNPDYICNPQTGRWVKKTGQIGQKITKKSLPMKKKIKKSLHMKKKIKKFLPKKKSLLIPKFQQHLNDSVYYLTHLTKTPTSHGVKIASFDIDGTIITTKSGNTFAKNIDDWKFLYDSIPSMLASYHQQGYKIVFFSNQKQSEN